ncbi:MAG: methionyl-tRNA formyltransferase [Lachnospiraceae bacterium]|nr:methionyl-tRNA formyltransferase [Lachnospiraceae bacterium]
MRVVFMGTPDFAVPVLEALTESKHEVVAVVTQPDKRKGRGKEMQCTPVKTAALNHGIEVYQPAKVKDEEFQNVLRDINADVIVVVAFGQILPPSIIHMPKYGCINVHASLLPKYRGAAPIQWAVIDGEKETGITTMQMDEGLDTGDMMLKEVVPVDEKETGGSLHDKLAACGGKIILETLQKVEDGTVTYTKQDDSKSNYAKMLDKNLGKIDFTKKAVEIERLIRGLNPWPSAYTKLNGKTLKIWDADVLEGENETPGKIVNITKDQIWISTGEVILAVNELQLEGKKRMNTEDFLRGYKMENAVLGMEE